MEETRVRTEGTPDTGMVITTEFKEGGALIQVVAPKGHFQEHQGPDGPYTSTPKVREKVPEQDRLDALARFGQENWGDVDEDDIKANSESRRDGEGIVMGFYGTEDCVFWIHQVDREPPTVLLPEEY